MAVVSYGRHGPDHLHGCDLGAVLADGRMICVAEIPALVESFLLPFRSGYGAGLASHKRIRYGRTKAEHAQIFVYIGDAQALLILIPSTQPVKINVGRVGYGVT